MGVPITPRSLHSQTEGKYAVLHLPVSSSSRQIKECETLQGKTIDDIISEWNLELEKRAQAFVKQASQLALWDRHILANRHTLLELEEELHKVALIPCPLNLS